MWCRSRFTGPGASAQSQPERGPSDRTAIDAMEAPWSGLTRKRVRGVYGAREGPKPLLQKRGALGGTQVVEGWFFVSLGAGR